MHYLKENVTRSFALLTHAGSYFVTDWDDDEKDRITLKTVQVLLAALNKRTMSVHKFKMILSNSDHPDEKASLPPFVINK